MGIKADKILKIALYMSGVFITLLIFLIFISLFKESFLSIKQLGIKFIIGKEWDPVSDKFGFLPFVIGTFITSILSLCISVPFGLSIAILSVLYFRNGPINTILTYTTDLLSGIPSVIYGFWGLYFLVPLVRNLEIKMGITPYGVGIITASIVLSIMIIPYISSISREIMKVVPTDIIEAGYALGSTKYEVIRKIILPYSSSGIFAGILLAFGRSFGETMAVTMVIGNSNFIPKSIFSPGNTMASLIANEFSEATRNIHLSSLIQIGLWLFIFTFIINVIGTLIVKRMGASNGS